MSMVKVEIMFVRPLCWFGYYIALQELSEHLGIKLLNERLQDPTMQESLESIFPKDNPKNTRFAINFFTSIGLGGITENLREYLKNMPRLIMQQQKQVPESESGSSSGSDSSGSESDSDSSSSSSSDESDREKRKRRRRSWEAVLFVIRQIFVWFDLNFSWELNEQIIWFCFLHVNPLIISWWQETKLDHQGCVIVNWSVWIFCYCLQKLKLFLIIFYMIYPKDT